jgi:mono/diheme cytochrome c family protein
MEKQMNSERLRWILAIGIIFLLAACTGDNEPPPTDTPVPAAVQEDDQGTTEDSDSAAEVSGSEDTESNDTAEESGPEPAAIDVAKLYKDNCSRCHGDKRQGGGGPPLLPERLTKEASYYAEFITKGSPPMPVFGNKLSAEEINALAEWILTPLE